MVLVVKFYFGFISINMFVFNVYCFLNVLFSYNIIPSTGQYLEQVEVTIR